MIGPVKVVDDIWWVGVNDRVTPLFENLWALPKGVSYNSYLIDDDKVALVDGVKADFYGEYIENIEGIIGEGRSVDYLIVNHMEPDHSGAIRMLRKAFPDMVVVGNRQTLAFLKNFYGDDDKVLEVKEGDVLDLGKHKLSFALIPMVHWPETMVTYDAMTGTLFSCDAFGGYGALDGSVFNDELDMDETECEIRRYYATIVSRFSSFVQKALAKCASLKIERICPSHGPVYRSGVDKIVDLYDRMSKQETEEGVVIAYGTMYGNTAKMAEAVAEGVRSAGKVKKVVVYNMAMAELSEVVRDIWRYRGLVLVSCAYNMGVFPKMYPLIEKIQNMNMEGRNIGVAASYTWSKGVSLKPLMELAENGKWKHVGSPVEVQSSASKEQLEQCRELGRAMAEAVVKD